MYRSITLLVIGLLLFCGFVHAQDSGFGLGIIIGEPTGISAKAWVGKYRAICGAAGWSLTEEKHFHIYGDYIFHNFELIKLEKGKLPIYYGFGCRIKAKEGSNTEIGVRIPLGMDYFIPNTPLDIFFELVPTLDVIPKTDVDINFGLGIRFFFGK
ncbi:MAG: DUF3996 domain-containing protein [Candidatus Bathyarchaeota archaeon]|nr:DUF3996 domain-containing protein [candidate division WOR-3 bacterium]MCW4043721.1 DUF3996 domain-containing protein [Candidatus Bathyarchaeota archaeon]